MQARARAKWALNASILTVALDNRHRRPQLLGLFALDSRIEIHMDIHRLRRCIRLVVIVHKSTRRAR